MATAAQTPANQANAPPSGPKRSEGKERAARNNTRHGLTLGVLVVEDHEKGAHAPSPPNFANRSAPAPAWRLRKVQILVAGLFTEYNGDPHIHPKPPPGSPRGTITAPPPKCFSTAARELREGQTLRRYRQAHLHSEESEHVPAMVNPGTPIYLAGQKLSFAGRSNVYER